MIPQAYQSEPSQQRERCGVRRPSSYKVGVLITTGAMIVLSILTTGCATNEKAGGRGGLSISIGNHSAVFLESIEDYKILAKSEYPAIDVRLVPIRVIESVAKELADSGFLDEADRVMVIQRPAVSIRISVWNSTRAETRVFYSREPFRPPEKYVRILGRLASHCSSEILVRLESLSEKKTD